MLPTLSTRRFSWPTSASALRSDVDDLFGHFFGDFLGNSDSATLRGWAAPVSIWDDEQKVYVEVELPGVSRDHIDLVVQEGRLRIRCERQLPSEERNYWYNERPFGAFERMISLSEMVDPDNIEATMHDGILSIQLLKRPEAQQRKIHIKAE